MSFESRSGVRALRETFSTFQPKLLVWVDAKEWQGREEGQLAKLTLTN